MRFPWLRCNRNLREIPEAVPPPRELGLHGPGWCLKGEVGLWGFLLSWVKAEWPSHGPFLYHLLSMASVGLDVVLSTKVLVSSVWQGEVGDAHPGWSANSRPRCSLQPAPPSHPPPPEEDGFYTFHVFSE